MFLLAPSKKGGGGQAGCLRHLKPCRAAQPRQLQATKDIVRAVVLRHAVRLPANFLLFIRAAAASGKCVYVWRSYDTNLDGSPLPDAVLESLEGQPPDSCGVPGLCGFFDGVLYTYSSTTSHSDTLGLARNNQLVGRALLLHPNEPPVPPHKRVWVLRYPPLAVFVEPQTAQLAGYTNPFPGAPRGTLPVTCAHVNITFKPFNASQNPAPPAVSSSQPCTRRRPSCARPLPGPPAQGSHFARHSSAGTRRSFGAPEPPPPLGPTAADAAAPEPPLPHAAQRIRSPYLHARGTRCPPRHLAASYCACGPPSTKSRSRLCGGAGRARTRGRAAAGGLKGQHVRPPMPPAGAASACDTAARA
jgi:hypothetical protein